MQVSKSSRGSVGQARDVFCIVSESRLQQAEYAMGFVKSNQAGRFLFSFSGTISGAVSALCDFEVETMFEVVLFVGFPLFAVVFLCLFFPLQICAVFLGGDVVQGFGCRFLFVCSQR